MCRVVILLSLAAAVMGQETFFKNYEFSKTMANCLGPDVYYAYLTSTQNARRECQQLPVSLLNMPRLDFRVYGQFGYPVTVGGQTVYVAPPSYHQKYYYNVPPHTHPELLHRQTREVEEAEIIEEEPEDQTASPSEEEQQQQQLPKYFDREFLSESINKIMAGLSNFTCILKKTNKIDDYLNIKLNDVVSDYFKLPIDDDLRQDLIAGLYFCNELVKCAPLEKSKSPLPVNLQRLLLSIKCEKKTRTEACLKHDIRKNLAAFDLSIFTQNEDQENILNKLSAILVGRDSVDELDLL